VLPDISNILTNSTSVLLSPSYQPGIWFYVLVFIVIFLGSVFIVTPFPVNSLLFVAVVMAVNHEVSLEWVLITAIAAAYSGYDVNYWSGRLFNFTVCRKTCPHIFDKENIGKAEELFNKFGPLSIIISRFIPIVNLPPFYAGLKSMNYIHYIIVNFVGAVLWCAIVTFLGYSVGNFNIIQDNLNLLFVMVILALIVTFLYSGITLTRNWIRGKNVPE
jgi:membrane-associated protein